MVLGFLVAALAVAFMSTAEPAGAELANWDQDVTAVEEQRRGD